MREWLEPMAEAGVDVFDCSQRRFWEPEFEGSDLNFAGWAKKLTGKPTITVGSIGLSTEFVSFFTDQKADYFVYSSTTNGGYLLCLQALKASGPRPPGMI